MWCSRFLPPRFLFPCSQMMEAAAPLQATRSGSDTPTSPLRTDAPGTDTAPGLHPSLTALLLDTLAPPLLQGTTFTVSWRLDIPEQQRGGHLRSTETTGRGRCVGKELIVHNHATTFMLFAMSIHHFQPLRVLLPPTYI